MVTENTEPIGETEVAQPAPQPEPEAPAKIFTQDEVNRIQAQTRREANARFGDYQELKTRAARADELEKSQLTDQEKLEARATAAERKAEAAIQQVASAVIASEVKVRASQLGIIDPDAAYLLLDRTNVAYADDGTVSGIDDALTQLIENKPYLKGAPNRAPNLNPQAGELAPTLRLSTDQLEAARLMGLTPEEYAQGL